MNYIEFPIAIPQNHLDGLNKESGKDNNINSKVLQILNNLVNDNGIQPPSVEVIVSQLQSLRERLDVVNVIHLILFGSTVRGEAGKGSDIDILVDFCSKVEDSDLEKVKEIIEETLGRKYKIDVVAKSRIQVEILKSAINEGIQIF